MHLAKELKSKLLNESVDFALMVKIKLFSLFVVLLLDRTVKESKPEKVSLLFKVPLFRSLFIKI